MADKNDERKLNEVDLPSGKTAKIVDYFTRGESRAIKKAKWQGAKMQPVDETGKMVVEDIPLNQDDLTNDEVVLQGVKEYDGNKMSDKVLDNMANQDFVVLLNKLQKLLADNLAVSKKKEKK